MGGFPVASLMAAGVFLFAVAVPLVALVNSRLLYPRRKRRRYRGEAEYSVNVVVPCQGFDEDLKNNLEAIADQDYAFFTVTFVTDTETDPAVPVIRSVVAGRPWAHHVVAGYTDTLCSQQNHVQAVAMTRDTVSDIFVKCDSDMRPPRGWLRELIRPFQDPDVAATTAHHWVSPRRPTFANACYTAYSGFLTTLGGWPSLSWIWGGCFAIRRTAFLALDVQRTWKKTGADDSTLRNLLVRARMKIVFVPDAVALTRETHEDLAEFMRWLARQLYHGRIYLRAIWTVVLVIETAMCLSLVVAAAILSFQIASSRLSAAGIADIAVLAAALSCGPIVKLSRLLQRDIPLTWWVAIGVVDHFLVCCALWRSAFMRGLHWRGFFYQFNRDGTIRTMVRQAHPSQVPS